MKFNLPAYGWKLMPHQVEAFRALRNSDIHEILLAWHRRAGKDEVILQGTVLDAMERPGTYWHMMPEFEQCRRAFWEEVNPTTGRLRWQDIFPPEIIKRVDNQGMAIWLHSGSVWRLVGSDNFDKRVGSSVLDITMSEAALSNPMAIPVLSPMVLKNGGKMKYVSSVRGRNHFYRMYQGLKARNDAFVSYLPADKTTVFTAEELQGEREKLIMAMGSTLGEAMFQQEYMCNWNSAIFGACWAKELATLQESGRARPCAWDDRYPVYTSWDLGVGDATVILFWQQIGNEYRMIDWYSGTEIGMPHYAEVLQDKPYFYAGHYAPHDIANKEWGSGEARIDEAKKFGIVFTRVPRVKEKRESVGYGARFLQRVVINIKEDSRKKPTDDCQFVLDAISQYHWGYNETTQTVSNKPVHDWTSDYADAFSTMAHFVALQNGRLLPKGRVQGLQGSNMVLPSKTPRMWMPDEDRMRMRGVCL